MMRVLITGISGQDGALLARQLVAEGCDVFGTTRAEGDTHLGNLRTMGIADRVTVIPLTLGLAAGSENVLRDTRPDEIYHLSAQSSVGQSFDEPVRTFQSVALESIALLDATLRVCRSARVFVAGSSEAIGECDRPADERTAQKPVSPYAIAKAAVRLAVESYRESHGLHACTGILFNHESPLRPARFVTRKICAAVARIAAGSSERLTLGDISIVRDWGWASEYVDAMRRVLRQPRPDDYVLATGYSGSLQDFVAAAFAAVGLDWRSHVDVDRSLFRLSDIRRSAANPSKAAEVLGWKAVNRLPEVARLMVNAEISRLDGEA